MYSGLFNLHQTDLKNVKVITLDLHFHIIKPYDTTICKQMHYDHVPSIVKDQLSLNITTIFLQKATFLCNEIPKFPIFPGMVGGHVAKFPFTTLPCLLFYSASALTITMYSNIYNNRETEILLACYYIFLFWQFVSA